MRAILNIAMMVPTIVAILLYVLYGVEAATRRPLL